MALNSNALVTTEYIRTFLDFASDKTPKYEEYINMASQLIESFTKRKLFQSDYQKDFDGNGLGFIILDQYPVNEVSAVFYDPSREFGSDTELTDFLYEEFGSLVFPGMVIEKAPQCVRVVYNAGYEIIPDDIRLATLETIAFISSRIGSSRIGMKTMNAPDGLNTSYELSLPLNARNLLEPYVRREVV